MQAEIYYDILSNKQREILPCLGFLKERQIYLAGGTALALQIGHRSSIDFDFYDKTEFELDTILRQFRQFFKKLSVIQMSNGTLIVDVEGIQVSVFYYDYKVIRPFFHTKHLLLLSLEDISAMKLIAIIQRGERQALTYFEEAEGALPGSRIGIFNDRPGWGEVKEYLIKVVTEYKKEKVR